MCLMFREKTIVTDTLLISFSIFMNYLAAVKTTIGKCVYNGISVSPGF